MEVTFRKIKFVIESYTTPDRVAAGLAVRGVRKVTFDQCMFVQNIGPFVQSVDITAPKLVPMASIYVAGANGVKPIVELKDCYFYGGRNPNDGGQVAVAIDGDADIRVTPGPRAGKHRTARFDLSHRRQAIPVCRPAELVSQSQCLG